MAQSSSTNEEGNKVGETNAESPQTEIAATKDTEAIESPGASPAEASVESAVETAEGEVGSSSKKEGKGKGKEGKEAKEPKGKGGKSKGKEGKSKDGKGKEGKSKEGNVKGKGNQKGAVKGSGPTAGGSGYRLNVKNLGKMTEEELKQLFEPFGEVSMAEVKKNEQGESRGFGFVVLPGEEEGEAAAKEMNGKEVNGAKLNVTAAERRATTEDETKGKGKGKGGYDMYTAQTMYAQQWAAYSQMMYMQQYAALHGQSLWANQGGQEYEGSLKSVSSRNGYGFIVCRETYELFGGRDVYIDQSLLPEGTARGTRLLFTVNGNEKGHPKAVTCRLAPQI